MLKYLWIFIFLVGCTKESSKQVSNDFQQIPLEAQGSGEFGTVNYGEIKIKSFTFKNNEPQSVAVAPVLEGLHSADFSIGLTLGCSQIETGKSCLVKVVFNSDKKTAGSYNANLKVGDNSYPLSAQIASVPSVKYELSLNTQKVENTLSLPNIVTNELRIYSLKLKNNSPIIANAGTLTSTNSFYNLMANSCINKLLKPSESCYAKLVIKGDDSNEVKSTTLNFDGKSFELQTENQAQVAVSSFSATTTSLELGDFYGDGDQVIKAIALQNDGNGAGSVENITLPPDYRVLTNNCSGVKPGNKCVIRIVYSSPEQPVKGQNSDSLNLGGAELEVISNQVNKPSDLGNIILTTLDNILVNECKALTVSMKDIEGLDYVISTDNTFSINQTLFQDSNCQTEALSKLAPFESSKTFYIKSLTSGNKTLTLLKNDKTVTKEVYFYNPLVIQENYKNLIVNQSYPIMFAGGKPPHTIEVLSGVGALVNGSFSSALAGAAQIKVTDALGNNGLIDIQVVSVLTANVNTFEKIVNQSQTLQGQNGLPPYSYSKVSGVGSIDSLGLFSAGNIAGTTELKITDSLGQEVVITGQVYGTLSVNPTAVNISLADSQQITVSGGKTPYTYTKISGVGTLTSQGLYSSENVGTAQLKVSDSLGQEILINATAVSNLVVSAGTCSFLVPEQKDCTVSVSGGVGNKFFSTTNGVINPTTGVFYGICSNNLGQSVVTATDERGNTGSVTLNYPCVYKSCIQIIAEGYGSASALYWLDIDNHRSGVDAFRAYCDMNLDGGGWTLVSSNNSSSSLIPSGVSRNNSLYQLDRATTLGEADPNSDYIIGSVISTMPYNQVRIVGFGGTSNAPTSIVASYPSDLKTFVKAIWSLTSTGANRLTEVVPRSSVSITGAVAGAAGYFVLDGVKKDGLTSGFAANSNQSTVGGVGVENANGDPALGTYLGHGITEGSFEGWYNTNTTTLNSVGYTTWVRPNYFKYAKDCADAKLNGYLNEDGISNSGMFSIDPDGFGNGVDSYRVYCDFNGNGSTLNATGGVISYDGNYKIHTYTNIGTSTFTITQGSGNVEYLVVAGGGGGGGRSGGGGGAGGLRNSSVFISTSQTVIVGKGGDGGAGTGPQGQKGDNSSFGSIVSLGGGGGAGDELQTGTAGGSGGGGKYGSAGSLGTPGQGFNGGSGTSQSWAAGGGGGAGGNGVNGVQGKCGNGGVGVQSAISGLATFYAGGGGGGSHNPEPGYGSACSRGLGGNGGGGAGGIPGGANNGVKGTDGLGAGGGGGSTASGNGGAGGNGGSGIVIIRYQYKY